MDPVVAVLGNVLLLQVICEFILEPSTPGYAEITRQAVAGRCRTLLSLALASRSTSKVALDVLWRNSGLDRIYYLFPAEMVSVGSDCGGAFTRPPTTSSHWSRFDSYSPRIHALHVSFSLYTSGPERQALKCVDLTGHPSQRYPFIHLTHLHWQSNSALVSNISVFLCPTLTSVNITLDYGDWGFADAMASVIRTMKETCTHLREFTYIHYDMTCSRSVLMEEAFTALICHAVHLQKVSIPVISNVLGELGRLPSLSALWLNSTSWQSDGAQEPYVMEEKQPRDREHFVALEHLTINRPPSIRLLTEWLRDIRCFPQRALSIAVSEPDSVSASDLAGLCRVILDPNISAGLQRFKVSKLPPAERPDDPWQPFRWLLSFPHLQHLHMEGFILNINDADLEEISQTWRDLRSLVFCIPLGSSARAQTTFSGLVHLSSIPHLQSITLSLSPDSSISTVMLSPATASISPLTTVHIRGHLPRDQSSLRVALFLAIYFPKLHKITTTNKSQWADVDALLGVARQMLRDKIAQVSA